MNRGKTITTSPPQEKFSMPSLNKALIVGSDKAGGIVEVFDIVPPILFWAVPGPAHKVFDSEILTFFDFALIKKVVNFEGPFGGRYHFLQLQRGATEGGAGGRDLRTGLELAQTEPQRKQGRSSSRSIPPACRQGDQFSERSRRGRRTIGLAS